jgi:serine/threonine-protein kinase
LSAQRSIVTPNSNKSTGGRARSVAASEQGSSKRSYEPGERIAERYLLKQKLGEGGMGAVFSAYDETLDVDVALKLIRVEELDGEGGALLGDRMLQEARAAARLGHPAIARVFDFGATHRGDPFIVMELLRGEDLADTLARRGQINPTKAVATLLPIAHALEAAHLKGIVHRDIKPENIYLARSEDGRVQPKLVDFGVAKIERAKNHRLTQTGAMLGSPVYMSPEQARGDDVDRLADVWALCVVLYEMIAGRPPFEGKNYNALLYSIIADEPESTVALGVGDAELWEILRQGLEKDPARRWQSMHLLGTRLARWLLAHQVQEDITGASVSAQWLWRVPTGADALASMMPPAEEPARDTPTQRIVLPVQLAPRVDRPLAKTVHRVRRGIMGRTVAQRVAGGSAALGVLLAGLASWAWWAMGSSPTTQDTTSNPTLQEVVVQEELASPATPKGEPAGHANTVLEPGTPAAGASGPAAETAGASEPPAGVAAVAKPAPAPSRENKASADRVKRAAPVARPSRTKKPALKDPFN